MNDLNGKCVNVVLTIDMGKGMEFLDRPIKIVANFHGRPLESDSIKQDGSPVFDTELMWEIEKKELRKLRASKSPLRVELHLIDVNQRTDRVGFILLSIRSAHIVSYKHDYKIPFKWYKLLGVLPEHKNFRPELRLSLTIRDTALEEDETPYLTDLTVEENEASIEEPFIVDGQVISLCYLPNGFIKIGGEECSEKYLLTIVIQVAYNLDSLLSEVDKTNHSKYFISFNMFGITIKSKPFCRNLHANIPMNEKIVVRLISEYEILRLYLTYHCQIVISFYAGSDQLGTTKLNVQSLLQNITEPEFIDLGCAVWCEQKCYLKGGFPSIGVITLGSNDRLPFIEVGTTLNRTESHPISSNAPSFQSLEYVTDPSELTESICKKDEITTELYQENLAELKDLNALSEDFYNACGDDNVLHDDGHKESKKEESAIGIGKMISASGDQKGHNFELKGFSLTQLTKKVHCIQSLTSRSDPVSESCKSVVIALENAPPLMSVTNNRRKSEKFSTNLSYQQYCLDVILENVTLKKSIKTKTLRIKFKHPKASTFIVIPTETENRIGEDIILESTRCKIFYISVKEQFRRMVYAWPPKLVLSDDSDRNLTEELDIYTALFLAKDRFECSYITECKAIRTYESLAKLNITMYLQEYGISALPEQNDLLLLPPILDEYIAIQELHELQCWKNKQKAQYTADLKILQKQGLALMHENWNARKIKMEEKLKKGIRRCESLSLELQTVVNTLRTKKALSEKEEDLKSDPNCAFQDLLDQNTINKLERENDNLKKIINDQRAEVEQIKKTALTKEQTTNLLQQLRGLEEKFEEAQKAKTYFKEQWKKAVREIHDLKAEDQKQIQEKIQSQKIELSQLSLENFIGDRNSVTNFDYVPNVLPASSQSTFGALKWDDSVTFDCSKDT
ncbi:hypothetical protein FQA39_LY01471 [Lamprigera yunnana]|nr:hypothetical protein FQA39_LY01471 [Lamprigera yunnana]